MQYPILEYEYDSTRTLFSALVLKRPNVNGKQGEGNINIIFFIYLHYFCSSGWGVKLTTYFLTVPMLKISGATPPLLQHLHKTWCLVDNREYFT